MEKANRENISQHLMEYQLKMVGKTLMDVVDDDRWRFNITMNLEQREEFRKYTIATIQRIFKCNRTKAENTYNTFIHDFGLRIKNK